MIHSQAFRQVAESWRVVARIAANPSTALSLALLAFMAPATGLAVSGHLEAAMTSLFSAPLAYDGLRILWRMNFLFFIGLGLFLGGAVRQDLAKPRGFALPALATKATIGMALVCVACVAPVSAFVAMRGQPAIAPAFAATAFFCMAVTAQGYLFARNPKVHLLAGLLGIAVVLNPSIGLGVAIGYPFAFALIAFTASAVMTLRELRSETWRARTLQAMRGNRDVIRKRFQKFHESIVFSSAPLRPAALHFARATQFEVSAGAQFRFVRSIIGVVIAYALVRTMMMPFFGDSETDSPMGWLTFAALPILAQYRVQPRLAPTVPRNMRHTIAWLASAAIAVGFGVRALVLIATEAFLLFRERGGSVVWGDVLEMALIALGVTAFLPISIWMAVKMSRIKPDIDFWAEGFARMIAVMIAGFSLGFGATQLLESFGPVAPVLLLGGSAAAIQLLYLRLLRTRYATADLA